MISAKVFAFSNVTELYNIEEMTTTVVLTMDNEMLRAAVNIDAILPCKFLA